MGHPKEYYAEWRAKNRQQIADYKRAWYARDKERIRGVNRKAYLAKWYKDGGVKLRQLRRENNQKRRLEILALFGSKCGSCNFSDWRALQIDHVNSDGTQERKSLGHSASALWKKVKECPEKYQLLCANCNWIKRHTHKELYTYE